MIRPLIEKKDMSFDEARKFFNELATQSDIRRAALLTALQSKGVTGVELAGLARAMRASAIRIDIPGACDTCGTGGDHSSSINVSTASAILLSCFVTVAKHGNGSVTSKSGSSTVMAELGIGMPTDPAALERGARSCNFAYLHAPYFHPALTGIMPVRRELGFPTVFNVIGPLANPASPTSQLIGVSSPELVLPVAEALAELGTRRALVVHGSGIDEVHPGGRTSCVLVDGQELLKFELYPSDFSMQSGRILPCSSPAESAMRIRQVLAGTGSADDTALIVLNAAAGLFAADYGDLLECKDAVMGSLGEQAIEQLEIIRNVYPQL